MVDVGADGESGNEVRKNKIRHLFVLEPIPAALVGLVLFPVVLLSCFSRFSCVFVCL